MRFGDSLGQDVRIGLRHFVRAPGFFLAAVITLALGIGANTAMFGVVYGVLLKPLPFDEPERLVSVYSTAPGIGWPRAVLTAAQYFTYRDEQRVFTDIAVWNATRATVTGGTEPERIDVLQVTDAFLPLLRVRPILGRAFTREDDTPAAPPRVLLGYAYWRQRFDGDPRVVGRSLIVNEQPREIIGVLPRDFAFMDTTPAMLLPQRFDRAATRIENFNFPGLARLKPGVTVEQANRDVERMLALLPQKFPLAPALPANWLADARLGPDVHLLSADVSGDVGEVLWVLMGTVGLVLLIACANVANLFLVRADSRQQELAVRAALGASAGRLTGTLLAESVMLGLAGGVAGVGLAAGAIRVVRATAPAALPRAGDIALDPMVLLFAAILSIAAGVLFGLPPALKFARPRLGSLNDGGRSASDGRQRHRARGALVVAEIALTLVMLVASGLMVRTFQALRQVDPGFVRGDEVLTFAVSLPGGRTPAEAESVTRRQEDLARRIRRVPGVQSVGFVSAVAFNGNGMHNPMLVEDFPARPGQAAVSRRMKWIAPGYFETMGTRVVAGRLLTWNDVFSFTPVILINERLAREYWQNPADAVGRRARATSESPWREIIGVVADERDDGLARHAPPIMYYPSLVKDFWAAGVQANATMTCVVRSSRTGTPPFTKEVREAVWSIDRNAPVSRVRSLADVTAASMAQTAFALVMLGIAAVVSLLLGLVGVYAVISYITAQRTREVGIRVALGARPWDIARQFLRHGVGLAALGVVIGVVAASALSRLMTSLLFGVTARDPLTYTIAAAVLTLTAALAGYLPSRRAARNDPSLALRS